MSKLPLGLTVWRDCVLCAHPEEGYYNFLRLAWHLIERRPLRGWYLKHICSELQKEVERVARGDLKTQGDLIVCLPPRTGKSSAAAIFLNAWAWTKYPWLKFLTVSYSSNLAEQHSIATKKILLSEWYRLRWEEQREVLVDGIATDVGGVKLDDTKNTNLLYQTTAGGERQATSVGGTVTGAGGDLIISDDLISVEESHSKAARERAVRFYRNTVKNRLNEPGVGVRVLVQQRTHDADVVGVEMREHPAGYRKVILPARYHKEAPIEPAHLISEYKRNRGLLDPVRFSAAILQDLEKSIDDFTEQYQQVTRKPGGNIIKEEWFFEYDMQQLLHLSQLHSEEIRWVFEVDGAFSDVQGEGAPNVCIAYCVLQHKAYIRAIFRQWVGFVDLVESLKRFVLLNGYSDHSEIHIEPKANGKDLIDVLVRQHGLNAMESYNPKYDKITMAHSITPELKAGRVGLLKSMAGKKEYIQEVTTFPRAEYADQVDTTVMVVHNGLRGVTGRSGVLASG